MSPTAGPGRRHSAPRRAAPAAGGSPPAAMVGTVAEVASLTIYPVKSCGGVDVSLLAERWPVDTEGLRHDREWVVVDADTGRFASQRATPRMATVRCSLDLTVGELVLSSAACGGALRVPLAAPAQTALSPRDVRVWEFKGQAHDEGDPAAEWMTRALAQDGGDGGGGRAFRLVRFDARLSSRPLDADFVGPDFEGGTRFSDGYPMLIASHESLGALNEALTAKGETAVPLERFRANIVVRGAAGKALAPYEEDTWLKFRCGGIDLAMVKPCARCTMPSVDQQTGHKPSPSEPLRTLTDTRKGSDLGYTRKKMSGGAYFGANVVALPGGTSASLGVGDAIQVIEAGAWE